MRRIFRLHLPDGRGPYVSSNWRWMPTHPLPSDALFGAPSPRSIRYWLNMGDFPLPSSSPDLFVSIFKVPSSALLPSPPDHYALVQEERVFLASRSTRLCTLPLQTFLSRFPA